MTRYPLYIFDLDGTLYRGAEAIPNAVDVVCKLKSDGSGVRYLTNNSSQTREFFLQKLCNMGFPAEIDEIESSAHGSAKHLSALGLCSIFVVGEPGLVATLREEGLTVVNADDHGAVSPDGPPSEAVLVGICKGFTYALMQEAMQRIRAGQTFIATNPDPTFPMEGGQLIPGAGSVVAGIKACAEKEPFVVGKPNPFLVNLVLAEAKCQPQDALVVGDRIDTDLFSGEQAGCPTHLVLTGVTQTPPPGQSCSFDLTGLL